MTEPLLMSQIDLDTLAGLIADKLAARMPGPSQTPKREGNNYLTRREAAERLTVSLPTLHRLTMTGKIQSHRIGRRVVYKPHEIEQALTKTNIH